jgi:hypothetical protein
MSDNVVVLQTEKRLADEAIVKALEELLTYAKAGKVQRLVVVGRNDVDGDSYFIKHNAIDVSMLGAVGAALFKLQRQWFGDTE